MLIHNPDMAPVLKYDYQHRSDDRGPLALRDERGPLALRDERGPLARIDGRGRLAR